MKEYLREAIIWRQLRHPNVLPCLGLYYLDDTQQRICLVSPWMENGNLVEYIQSHPRESINHILLMHDITSGLSHLHALKIVHGDLKGFNVLITRSHRACLADFGLSHVSDSQVFKVTSTVAHSAGIARWSAPEIHTGASSSTQSDIYSIGCLYYEIITGLRPFYNLRNDAAVLLADLQGQRPEKPRNVDIDMQIWSLMNDCWETDPSWRPTSENLLQRLPVYGDVVPAEDWDNKLFNELQRNVAASDKTYSPLASIFYQSGMRLRSPSALTSSVIADNPRLGRKRIRLQSDFGKAERQQSYISGMNPGFSLRGVERQSKSSTYRYDNATNGMGMGVGGTAQITGSPEPEQHPSDAWGTFMRPAPAGSSSNSSYPYTQGAEPSSWLPSGSNLDIPDNRVNHTLPTLPAFSSLFSTTDTIRQPEEQQQAGFRDTNDLGRFETAVLTRELPNLNFGRDRSWSSFFYGDPSAKPNTPGDEGRW
ncbi:hypothetical protein VNI00_015267 [Paramarasmius palmivorus]|uniref:Protein kinase domain-containing protein n=1 Tax=Paramarasmius palmivorus TaxID=297713 RepID=A0AAW0BPP9_9AGAR